MGKKKKNKEVLRLISPRYEINQQTGHPQMVRLTHEEEAENRRTRKKIEVIRKKLPEPYRTALTDEQVLIWKSFKKSTIKQIMQHAMVVLHATTDSKDYSALLGKVIQLVKVQHEIKDPNAKSDETLKLNIFTSVIGQDDES